MTEGLPWTVLDIEPTRDQRAIRVAYSAKLKAIDPEADPKAFIALRDAFEAARNFTLMEEQPDASDWALPTVLESEIAAVEHTHADSLQDWESSAAEPDPIDAHAHAIIALLYREHANPWLDDTARAELIEHWRAIAADPQMAEVDRFDRVEQWIAQVIAETAPTSSPLVVPATDYFGWLASEGALAQGPAVAQIVYRYRQIKFISAAQRPEHSHHPAWAELTTPAYPGAPRGRVDPHLVYELLGTIRTASPAIQARLDPRRLALWEHVFQNPEIRAAYGDAPPPRTIFAQWIWLIWLGLIALGVLARLGGGQ